LSMPSLPESVRLEIERRLATGERVKAKKIVKLRASAEAEARAYKAVRRLAPDQKTFDGVDNRP
jgi:hypothetical protein